MNKEELIANIRSSLSEFRNDALNSGLLSSTDVTAKELSVRNAGHQNTTIFPFNRKKHMKFERLEDENIIISPYYDNTRAIVGRNMDYMNTEELFGLNKTVRSDWCSALTCDFEESVVYLDNIEAYGTLWRLVKAKSINSQAGTSADMGSVQTAMLSSSGSQLLSAAYEHQSKYHLQSCEVGATCLYLTRDLEVSPRILDAAEFVFNPLPIPIPIPVPSAATDGSGKGSSSTSTGPNKNNVGDNNVFGCLCQIKLFNPVGKPGSPVKVKARGEASPDDLYLVSDKLSGVALITMAEFDILERENREGVMADSQGSGGSDRTAGGGRDTEDSRAAVENSLQSTLYWDIFPEDTSTLKTDTLPEFFNMTSEAELQSIFL